MNSGKGLSATLQLKSKDVSDFGTTCSGTSRSLALTGQRERNAVLLVKLQHNDPIADPTSDASEHCATASLNL